MSKGMNKGARSGGAKSNCTSKGKCNSSRAYDPARPRFKHYEDFGSDHDMGVVKSISTFLTRFVFQGTCEAKIRVKRVRKNFFESFQLLDPRDEIAISMMLIDSSWHCEDVFFQVNAVDLTDNRGVTWFGGADTGATRPQDYPQKPMAAWETSPGNFQAVWKWERAIPYAASSARLEALLHEYGGKIGSQLPDAYLRVPGFPNYTKNLDQWPIVRMRFDAFPIEEIRRDRLFSKGNAYLPDRPFKAR